MRIGIVGGGSIARKAYLPLLTNWPDTEIVGVSSRTQKTVDEVCGRWGIEFGTTDLGALLEREPDVVFVLTATPSHFEVSRRVLDSGVDLYLEKPATELSHQTQQLAELADNNDLIFMVGFNRRYALLYKKAKEVFGERRVQMCIIEKHRPSAYHTSLFNNYLDDTIHQIDLLRFFCDDARAAHTSFEMRGGKLVGATSVTSLPDGGMGIIATSLQAGLWQEYATIHGEGLTVEVSAFREMRVKHLDGVEVFGADRPGRWLPQLEERGFKGEVEHFLECVRDRAVPATNGYEAARTQALVEDLVTVAGEEPRPT